MNTTIEQFQSLAPTTPLLAALAKLRETPLDRLHSQPTEDGWIIWGEVKR